MQSGLKFGNSFSGKHIQYFRNKMNVKTAAQTFISSVADAIEFMMFSVILFSMRTNDRLSNFLNVKNPYGKGFKEPFKLCNQII